MVIWIILTSLYWIREYVHIYSAVGQFLLYNIYRIWNYFPLLL